MTAPIPTRAEPSRAREAGSGAGSGGRAICRTAGDVLSSVNSTAKVWVPAGKVQDSEFVLASAGSPQTKVAPTPVLKLPSVQTVPPSSWVMLVLIGVDEV